MLKRLKLRFTFVLVLALVLGIVSSATVYASNNDSKNSIVKKTEKRLEAANNDIKSTLKLDNILNDYKQIDFPNGIDFNKDLDIAQEFDALDQSPIGSTMPIFLLKNDLSEIMVLYKEGDGTNVMKYAKRVNGNKWAEGEKRIKGAPILDINTIKDE
ncbi:hypothetical protein Dtox_0394 [Desulfofarcimen acetoxidans DSM 771]|uniref:Methyl-accepting chemotaxis protein n=1 Tax=Desulfofarcimen acetoxidans (strain ATCC 49208 / DSM 771 / KCTC 5769 / VKM B-1644 / 5575) TaxID=485916 RepID=C8W4Y6_DESAS|nr:hypothetical protein [Desulfofarcimen acetoxidans]ACV61338.1 hypothetical protein Dtox_0394 [Desulfofarcimen acetoxidans DSM 771]